ncbi:MAG: hypothetical protein INQ03_23650 [Candidatus Heimdallarchaeota archaeon]|nr:hypothetical protein [Candidatus Heimdallarchaeota archaeon]
MPDPSDEELSLLKRLFENWSDGSNQTVLNHLFEVVESHESGKIRSLAVKSIQENFPKERINNFIDLWITHPLPDFLEFIESLLQKNLLSKPYRSVIFLMLDRLENMYTEDPELNHLDAYMNTLDPLLGSLVFRRYALLTSGKKKTPSKRELSIIDLLRLQDYQQLWDNILEYPIPFICELIKILHEENWTPIDPSDKNLFDHLHELLGYKGWRNVSEVLNLVVSKEENGSFRPLTNAELREKEYHLIISPEIIHRPDRIHKQEFVQRGTRNMVNMDLGIHLYYESIRKSEVDSLLHIPIYSNNGVELLDFSISAPSMNYFTMDDDGLYFTVRNKQGNFSVDLDALAALLLPVSKHSSNVSEVIPIMMEKASGKSLLVLEGLSLLSTIHLGREYKLFDKKDHKIIDHVLHARKGCQCTLALDLGNTTTKVLLLPGGTCDHESEKWNFPSVIHYKSPSEYVVADAVIEEGLLDSSQTFRHMKAKLFSDQKEKVMIHSSSISIEIAILDFVRGVISRIHSEISYQFPNLAILYSAESPAGFDVWLRKELHDLPFENVLLVDELTALAVANYRIDNIRGNTLIFDLGSSQSAAILCDFSGAKSRKRTLNTRISEDPIEPPIIRTKQILKHGTTSVYSELVDKFHVKHYRIDELLRDLYNGYEIPFTEFELDDLIQESEYFENIKQLIRNTDHIIKKTNFDIEQIYLTGKFSRNTIIKELFLEKYEGIEIIEDYKVYGAALISHGQSFMTNLDQDYFVKITNRGLTTFSKIMARDEIGSNMIKSFDIRPGAHFEKMVIDLWTRRPLFNIKKTKKPVFADEFLEINLGEGEEVFKLEFILRDMVQFKEGGTLFVKSNHQGLLSFDIDTDGKIYTIDTFVMLQ